MDMIYIKASKTKTTNTYTVNLETLVVIFVYRTCGNPKNTRLNLLLNQSNSTPSFAIDFSEIPHSIIELPLIPQEAFYCNWPVFISNLSVVAGVCSVCRQILKASANESTKKLLGFREACLMSCAETSIWTKFCEIDMIETVKSVIDVEDGYFKGGTIFLPKDLTRFEYHMQQPVKLHNVYKLARDKNNDRLIKSSVPLHELNLEHSYAEGYFKTLSDIILYILYEILVEIFNKDLFKSNLPLSYAWFQNLSKEMGFKLKYEILNFEREKIVFNEVKQEVIKKESLYTSDPKRYKPQNRVFTKQNDIENAISNLRLLNVQICNEGVPFGAEIEIARNDVLTSNFEMVPEKRLARKCEQLENLARAVLKIVNSVDMMRNENEIKNENVVKNEIVVKSEDVMKISKGVMKNEDVMKNGDVMKSNHVIKSNHVMKIVDFCSGSGHLGILIAKLLPNCHVILVENKEQSLKRAKQHITSLNLKNVTILQCNLDYFCAKFDLGMSLHACGVATDLVMQNCVYNKAHFVCCPCCYGGIHNCHSLSYPRSEVFKKFSYKDFLNMAHAADQTHDKGNAKTEQGYFCMDVIDTDRKLWAQSCGYEVFLGKLLPVTCTPKNNLIVGVFRATQSCL